VGHHYHVQLSLLLNFFFFVIVAMNTYQSLDWSNLICSVAELLTLCVCQACHEPTITLIVISIVQLSIELSSDNILIDCCRKLNNLTPFTLFFPLSPPWYLYLSRFLSLSPSRSVCFPRSFLSVIGVLWLTCGI